MRWVGEAGRNDAEEPRVGCVQDTEGRAEPNQSVEGEATVQLSRRRGEVIGAMNEGCICVELVQPLSTWERMFQRKRRTH